MKNVSRAEDILQGVERRYDNLHDASMRLSRTIVVYKDEPIYVREIFEDLRAAVWDLKEGSEYFVIDVNDRHLDIRSIPLSYVNLDGLAAYPFRSTPRQQAQGVRIGHLSAYRPGLGVSPGFSESTANFIGFGKALRGLYPKIHELPEHGGAFAKTWAFGKVSHDNVYVLCHKMTPVGHYFRKEKKFVLRSSLMTPLRRRSFENTMMKQESAYHVTER